jgi:cytochrome o ubiquinol oxidase subunit 2
VNYAYIPVGTPVDFEITSDTVMTSFWVPQLGGQMYAMPGMMTHLNLKASKVGHYNGVAANISGKGFADQKFTVGAVRPDLFGLTMKSLHASTTMLDTSSYAALARPSTMTSPVYYGSVEPNLYDTIIMKYMMPTGQNTNIHEEAH